MSTKLEVIDAEIMSEPLPVSQALAVRGSFEPAMSLEVASDRYTAFRAFVQKVMREGTDYGTIPGTGKPTLFKPGAEKICTLFGLSERMEMADKLEDWDKGLVFYRYRCALWRGDVLVAEAEGSCNSREKKYAKRDTFDIANTVLKMAQKRALVAAALLAGNASEFFTQDLEDAPPARSNAATPEQLTEIARLAALVPIAAEEACAKACGMPLAEIQQGQAQRLIGLLTAKLKQKAMAKTAEAEEVPTAVIGDGREGEPYHTTEDVERENAPAPKASSEPDRAPRSAHGEAVARLKETLETGGVEVKAFCNERGIKRWSALTVERLYELIEEAEKLAEAAVRHFAKGPLPLVLISENQQANLTAAFEDRGEDMAAWLKSHGVESGRASDCTPELFDEAIASLY